MLERFKIDNDSPLEEIFSALEDVALGGNDTASMELGYYYKFFSKDEQALKWFLICELFCEDEGAKSASIDEAKILENSMPSMKVFLAKAEATAWLRDKVASAEQSSSYRVKEAAETKKPLPEAVYPGEFYVLMIGISDMSFFRHLKLP